MLCMENLPQAVLALVFLYLEGGSLVVTQLALANAGGSLGWVKDMGSGLWVIELDGIEGDMYIRSGKMTTVFSYFWGLPSCKVMGIFMGYVSF